MLGRTQGDHHPGRHQGPGKENHPDPRRPRHPACAHPRRRHRPATDRAQGDARSTRGKPAPGRPANRRIPSGRHRVLPQWSRIDGRSDPHGRRRGRWHSAFRVHPRSGRQLGEVSHGPGRTQRLPGGCALRRNRRPAFTLSRSARRRGPQPRHGFAGHGQPHHGHGLLRQRLLRQTVSLARAFGDQLCLLPHRKHPPARSLRQFPETPGRDPGQRVAGSRHERVLRPGLHRRSVVPAGQRQHSAGARSRPAHLPHARLSQPAKCAGPGDGQ
ncbi:hypothetical protein D3C71_1069970 [compost metagenome]